MNTSPCITLRSTLRHALISVILSFIMAALSLAGCSRTAIQSPDKYYQDFQNAHETMRFDQLGYKDTFEIWNGAETCCDVNSILSFGRTYARNSILVLPGNDGGYALTRDKESKAITDSAISYINIKNNIIYYRRDDSRSIESYDMENDKRNTLVSDAVGEVYVYEDRLYFVRLDDGNLISSNTYGTDQKVAYAHPIRSFVICADKIILLDNNMRLIVTAANGQEEDRVQLASNVEQFFLNGNIVIQSGKRIMSFDVNGRDAQIIYESSAQNMHLCGLMGDAILIQEDGKLYSYINSEKTALVDKVHSFYESISPSDDGKAYAVAVNNAEGQAASYELIVI